MSHYRYRSSDGTCNNLKYPKRGSSGSEYGKFFDPLFGDGIETFRKSFITNKDLPDPRPMVNEFFDNCRNENGNRPNAPNMGAVMLGQLITHDISLQVGPQLKKVGDGLTACTKDGKSSLPAHLTHPDVYAIKVPPNDPRVPQMGCLNFIRTQSIVNNNCELSSRRATNLQTSFIDLSNVYGPKTTVTNSIRSFSNGLFRMDIKNVLPVDSANNFILADPRIDQSPILTLLHSLQYRQHNRIASALKVLHPSWNDETLFNEARRYTVAIFQYIVWNEWIPVFHGEWKYYYFFIFLIQVSLIYHDKFYTGNLTQRFKQTYSDVDPTTSSDFAHSAFRYQHQFNPEFYAYFNASKWLFYNYYNRIYDFINICHEFYIIHIFSHFNEYKIFLQNIFFTT